MLVQKRPRIERFLTGSDNDICLFITPQWHIAIKNAVTSCNEFVFSIYGRKIIISKML